MSKPYVTDRRCRWFVFGRKDDGTCSVSDEDDVARGVPVRQAEQLIDRHNAVVERLEAHIVECYRALDAANIDRPTAPDVLLPAPAALEGA